MNKSFQILSLDGGGIKGLFAAAFLAKLEEDLGITVIDHFDLIVGTSTGGIIALGLGLGLTPKKIVDFYFQKGPQIFGKVPLLTDFLHWFITKYSGRRIEKVLKGDDCFGERLLGESKKRLVIPSYNIDSNDVYLFKTAHHERLRRDYKLPAWKIARATTAAPTFFPISTIIDGISLIDGGVWANNPAMVGLFEAISILDIPMKDVKILSIGTTQEIKRKSFLRACSESLGGLLCWAGSAPELIMQAQGVSISRQLKLLLNENFERVHPSVPEGLFGLDKMNLKKLFAFASKYSREFSPIFVNKFKEHIAEEFVPFQNRR